jgi:hypothetical protein
MMEGRTAAVSQTSRSNVRTLRTSPNLSSAPERTTLLRLTLRAQSRSAASPDSKAEDDAPNPGFASPSR